MLIAWSLIEILGAGISGIVGTIFLLGLIGVIVSPLIFAIDAWMLRRGPRATRCKPVYSGITGEQQLPCPHPKRRPE